jgi:6-phosphogluconate dehydrogenase
MEMQLGMIGLGRMGSNMVRRLLRAGHECVVHDRSTRAAAEVAASGATIAASLQDLKDRLRPPRAVWLMIPAAAVDRVIDDLAGVLEKGDVVIDGGNSYYRDDIDRAERLRAAGIRYVDCGTSGGVWGLERGYCLMIGGEVETVRGLDPIFRALAPGRGSIPRTPGREGAGTPAEEGYLHCGPHGAGHFVKMVHNGIEYGAMAAYAEGFNLLKHAGIGKEDRAVDAETTPLRDPRYYRFDFDLKEIAEVWRRGSVITSWLLDLTAEALTRSPGLEEFSGRVADSGEGRWTVLAAVEEGVPAHVLTASLYQRFDSRGSAEFQNKVLSAMRFGFGGHEEKKENR